MHIVLSPRQVGGQPTAVPGNYHYWVRNYSACGEWERRLDHRDALGAKGTLARP